MMEKLAQAGEGGRFHTHPLSLVSTITYKVVVHAPAVRAESPYLYSIPTLLVGW